MYQSLRYAFMPGAFLFLGPHLFKGIRVFKGILIFKDVMLPVAIFQSYPYSVFPEASTK
jgi:hypothetical protein